MVVKRAFVASCAYFSGDGFYDSSIFALRGSLDEKFGAVFVAVIYLFHALFVNHGLI